MPTQMLWRSVPQLGERSSRQWYNNLPSIAMSGTLYVVATPIGNLEDVTLRALRVLREVDVVACEDTRRTRALLAHFDIHTPTLSYFEHNKLARGPQILRQLAAGKSVALVTDAGTPGISDPGFMLVRDARAVGGGGGAVGGRRAGRPVRVRRIPAREVGPAPQPAGRAARPEDDGRPLRVAAPHPGHAGCDRGGVRRARDRRRP